MIKRICANSFKEITHNSLKIFPSTFHWLYSVRDFEKCVCVCVCVCVYVFLVEHIITLIKTGEGKSRYFGR